MGGDKIEQIEAAADGLAAAVFALAAAFGVWKFIPAGGFAFQAGAGLLSYLLIVRLLRGIGDGPPRFRIPKFEIPAFEPVELPELLLTEQVELILTEADRLQPQEPHRPDELLLDDILAEIGQNSRVVRLFDPATMPTPGQLNARIVRHLNDGTSPAAPPDASQALYDALAELRRSLR
jgi:hypothetical protein